MRSTGCLNSHEPAIFITMLALALSAGVDINTSARRSPALDYANRLDGSL